MDLLQVLFFLLFHFSITCATKPCPVSVCRSDQIGIRFPFSLQGKQPQNCGYPGFNLSCNDQGVTVLNLPYSGDFLVRNITYQTQQVQVYDPNNCLAGRLLSLNLSGSPFRTAFYQNYTFLRCPTQLITPRFTPINCLSNSTTSVLATSSMNLVNAMSTSCDIIDTLPTPVDLNDDLKLTWILPNYTDCETGGGICGFKCNTTQEIGCSYDSSSGGPKNGLEIFRLIALAIGVPIMIFVVFAVGFSLSAYLLDPGNRNSTPAASATPQPPVALTGLNQSTIESYRKVVLGESSRQPTGLDDSTCPLIDRTCAICLSGYRSKDTLGCISCKHCFHAHCIDEWFRLNGTCPICRNASSHANVPS